MSTNLYMMFVVLVLILLFVLLNVGPLMNAF